MAEMTEETKDLVLAYRVLSEEQDRLIIRGTRVEHVVVLIVLILGTAIFGPGLLYGIYAEAQNPGSVGQYVVLDELGVHKGESGSSSHQILAMACSWLLILFSGMMLLFCCRKLYRKLAHGRPQMILDRSEDSLILSKERICPLSTIVHVAVTQAEVDGDDRYCVDLVSEDPLRRMREVRQVIREDLLSFPRQEEAEQFAQRIAAFIHVDVVKGSGDELEATP